MNLPLPKSHSLVRPFAPTPAEFQTMAKEANNPLISKWMRNAFPSPYNPENAESWIEFANSQSPLRDFAICAADTNTLIGAIGLKTRDDIQYRTMEIGYWLGQEHWGKGVATEAVVVFSGWVFETFAHVVRLEAEVFEGNEGSKRVLEKAGFVCEGRRRWGVEKGGVLLDTFVYCLFREGA
ncbi:acyl-CoA N-acyltransferase [Aspergillus cavernicola]|uniref:Acyl-CoA N-acyltransferase n=1 Tax=Aspergillus cavernicola TaxID=176166 RepID=A0ABR4IKF7_9EURO